MASSHGSCWMQRARFMHRPPAGDLPCGACAEGGRMSAQCQLVDCAANEAPTCPERALPQASQWTLRMSSIFFGYTSGLPLDDSPLRLTNGFSVKRLAFNLWVHPGDAMQVGKRNPLGTVTFTQIDFAAHRQTGVVALR